MLLATAGILHFVQSCYTIYGHLGNNKRTLPYFPPNKKLGLAAWGIIRT